MEGTKAAEMDGELEETKDIVLSFSRHLATGLVILTSYTVSNIWVSKILSRFSFNPSTSGWINSYVRHSYLHPYRKENDF
jgi:hypothetical protein